ncbi:hypothetical protein FB567DRAFT_277246 [Paraphoma chrysanthemicola]|uniref:GPI anchored protein n=1 Tax=Paraphoma chrysanthemicola TaxID=798071 RepID=A0A8K0RAR1_9PLEO|nr:hypothetical protein FB567DRAFT_277246 [Paraphoma chrysanthemicola]
MRQSLVILSVLAGGAYAADTIQFFLPGGNEGVDPVATIKSVRPSTTEFSIACPTGTDINDCGFPPGLDMTIVSGTKYLASMSYDSYSLSYSCDYNSRATDITCAVSMTGGNMDTPGPQTSVLSGTDLTFVTATVVQGAGLLSGSGAASAAPKSTPASGSGLMTDASPSITGSGSMSGLVRSQSGSATGSASPAQQTGAATTFGVQIPAMLAVVAAVAVAAI